MKRDSTLSLFTAFTFHALLFAGLFFNGFSKINQPQTSLVIEAHLIDKTQQQAQKNKKEHHEKSDKSGEEKHRDEKNGTHEARTAAEAEHKDHQHLAAKLAPIFQPLPEIPQELRYEAFNSEVVARFHVSAAGDVTSVELIKPCSNPRLNQMLLTTLRQWKFSQSEKSFAQDIRVTFAVE
jgi:protein TonB